MANFRPVHCFCRGCPQPALAFSRYMPVSLLARHSNLLAWLTDFICLCVFVRVITTLPTHYVCYHPSAVAAGYVSSSS